MPGLQPEHFISGCHWSPTQLVEVLQKHCFAVAAAVVAMQVDKSIIGWDSTIGAWSRLENHCVLGEDVQVKVSMC
jgi:NDP-sugar pyrophosphorylase family protein